MARLSPITLSLAAIMVAVLSGAVFLFVHARQFRPEPAKDLEPVAAPAPPPPARAPEPLLPPAAPAVAVVETPVEVDAQAFAEDQQPPAPNRRGLLVVNHNRRLQEADENVFATLALPESTRTSIRQINDEYRRRTEPAGDAAGGAAASAPGDAQAALKARQDALTLLLGTDSAKSFDSEERIAVMRLRGKYRYEWGRQLRQ